MGRVYFTENSLSSENMPFGSGVKYWPLVVRGGFYQAISDSGVFWAVGNASQYGGFGQYRRRHPRGQAHNPALRSLRGPVANLPESGVDPLESHPQ